MPDNNDKAFWKRKTRLGLLQIAIALVWQGDSAPWSDDCRKTLPN